MKLTIITSEKPQIITKQFFYKNGNLEKKTSANMIEGSAKTFEFENLSVFAQMLSNLKSNNALCFGVTHIENPKIKTKEVAERIANAEIISRTREHFMFVGAGIMMIDYDPRNSAMDYQTIKTILSKYFGENFPHVWIPSASSCIYYNDNELIGIKGQRFYIPVQDTSDIERCGKALFKRMWLDGYGYIDLSAAGSYLTRGLCDNSVWQPERLDFAAGAQCNDGLTQKRNVIIVDGEPIDTTKIKSLSTQLEKQYKEKITLAQKELEDEAMAIREQRAHNNAAKLHKKGSPEYNEAYKNNIKTLNNNNKTLYQTHVIYLKNREQVTVEQILLNEAEYENQLCYDPLEPEYNDWHLCAKIMRNQAGKLFISSRAHGGSNYTLKWVNPTPNRFPFAIMGRLQDDAKKYAYYTESGSIVVLASSEHTSKGLLTLHADINFWKEKYSNDDGEIDTNMVCSDLFALAEKKIYDKAKQRGVGVWVDNDNIIVHFGDKLLSCAENFEYDISDFTSDFFYVRQKKIAIADCDVASINLTKKIYNVFQYLPINPNHDFIKTLFAGWLWCAPVGGALDWRPHIWLSGEKSSGKSWVIDNIIKKLIQDWGFYLHGESTEAGIRQKIGNGSLPVFLDEAEGEQEKSQKNIQAVLALARASSSSNSTEQVKGGKDGESMSFQAKSMFCFLSIAPNIIQNSDASRIIQIELNKKKYGSETQYKNLINAKQILSKENCESYLKRVFITVPILRQNIHMFIKCLEPYINDSRAVLQVATLMAGSAMYFFEEPMNESEVNQYLKNFICGGMCEYFTNEYKHQSDADDFLTTILSIQVRLENKTETVSSIFEKLSNDPTDKQLKNALGAIGLGFMRKDDMSLWLRIAVNHEQLRQSLKGTRFEGNWSVRAKQCEGAEFENKMHRFLSGDKVRKCIDIPIEI